MNKSIKTEIIINASKEEVWEALTNFENYPEWNPFVVNIEGRLEKGFRLRNTLKSGGKTFVFKPLVVDVKPCKSFSWLGSLFIKGLFDGRHYFEIEEVNSRQVKLVHGEQFSGLLSSFILKKIGDETRSNFVRMNQALKNYSEK